MTYQDAPWKVYALQKERDDEGIFEDIFEWNGDQMEYSWYESVEGELTTFEIGGDIGDWNGFEISIE